MKDQANVLREMVKNRKDGAPAGSARVITVTSGKGGVGKTNFSVNLSIALSRAGMRVLLVDADFGLSNVDVVMGVSPAFDMSYVAGGLKSVREVMTRGPEGLMFLSGGSGIYDLIHMDDAMLDGILSELSDTEGMFDYIIFDTGAGVSDNVLRMVRAAGEAIIITTPEPTAILDAYALIKIVSRSEPEGVRLCAVVNMASSDAEGAATLAKFRKVVRMYLGVNIDGLGYLTYDPNVSRSVKMQKPLMECFPRTAAARGIEGIAAELMGLSRAGRQSGVKGFFASLFGRT